MIMGIKPIALPGRFKIPARIKNFNKLAVNELKGLIYLLSGN